MENSFSRPGHRIQSTSPSSKTQEIEAVTPSLLEHRQQRAPPVVSVYDSMHRYSVSVGTQSVLHALF